MKSDAAKSEINASIISIALSIVTTVAVAAAAAAAAATVKIMTIKYILS